MADTQAAITVNGARLHVELLGPEDAPALVCLHGAPGLGDCREHVAGFRPLADAHRVVCFDARGSGRSQELEPYSHEQWAADIDALTRQLGIGRFALLGHSYGGIMAQEYAVRHGERLSALVLIDTAPATVDDDAAISRALASGLPGIEEGWLRQLFEGRVDSDEQLLEMWTLLLPLYFEDGLAPEQARALADDTFFHYRTHNHAFSVNNPNFDVRAQLGTIAAPTLIVCGDNDWITPLTRSREIAVRIPDGRLEVLPGCGHMPLAEQPDRLLALVRTFLADATA